LSRGRVCADARHLTEAARRADRSGRLVSSKDAIRRLIVVALASEGVADVLVNVYACDPDSRGCNWIAVVNGARDELPVDSTVLLIRILETLCAAYNLPSERFH